MAGVEMGKHETLIGQTETKSMSSIDHNKCIMEQDSRPKSTKTIEETYKELEFLAGRAVPETPKDIQRHSPHTRPVHSLLASLQLMSVYCYLYVLYN